MMRALADRIFPSPLGRSLSLMGLGVASVLVPVTVGMNIDTIRAAMPDMAALAQMLSGPPGNPGLVTFGPLARVNEGDHDFRQLIRFSLPAAAGTVQVRVFDPDAGGAYDEAKGGFDTATRFSLYGAGAMFIW